MNSDLIYEKILLNKEVVIEIEGNTVYLSEDRYEEYGEDFSDITLAWDGYILSECAPVLEYVINEEQHLDVINPSKGELFYMVKDNAFYNFGEWIVRYYDNFDEIVDKCELEIKVIK